MITQNSKVYTVCSLSHAAGLLAQTLPALEVEATVFIESFNPFVFIWIKIVLKISLTVI